MPQTLADKLKQSGVTNSSKRKEPLWKGPESVDKEGGITFSLLSRFIVCPERFRIYAIEGLKPRDQFNHRMEYGNMWHICEEYKDKNWDTPLLDYAKQLVTKYPTSGEDIDKWYNVCKIQFPIYMDYWSKHPDMTNRTPLLNEEKFNVPYALPSGRVVYLRGKWDQVDLVKERNQQYVWLQENKAKGNMNPIQLQKQLSFDLQVMMYVIALDSYIKYWKIKSNTFASFGGVRYNVIKRPLSSGSGNTNIRQKQPTKSNPLGESKSSYFARLKGIIDGSGGEDVLGPDNFFYRWNISISQKDIDTFCRTCLDPILETVCIWYDYINKNNLGMPLISNYIHWRRPYGVYNVLDAGGTSDYDEYLSSGIEIGLEQATTLFPELQ